MTTVFYFSFTLSAQKTFHFLQSLKQQQKALILLFYSATISNFYLIQEGLIQDLSRKDDSLLSFFYTVSSFFLFL